MPRGVLPGLATYSARGCMRISRQTPGGKKLDLAVLEPGPFFGEMPLLGER